MANWGGLNNALTAFKGAVDRRFPDRDRRTDGARADGNHGSNSQHQEDSDGTVDAWDQDVNVLASGTSTGSDAEKRLIEAFKKDFERDRYGRGHLWIHNRVISQHDEGWDNDSYGGESPHTEHAHWEARQDREDDGREWLMPETDKVMSEMGIGAVTKEDAQLFVKTWLETMVESPSLGDRTLRDWIKGGHEANRSVGTLSGVVNGLVVKVDGIAADINGLAPEIVSGVLAGLPVETLAEAIVALLPPNTLTLADVEQAVRNVLRNGVDAA